MAAEPGSAGFSGDAGADGSEGLVGAAAGIAGSFGVAAGDTCSCPLVVFRDGSSLRTGRAAAVKSVIAAAIATIVSTADFFKPMVLVPLQLSIFPNLFSA